MSNYEITYIESARAFWVYTSYGFPLTMNHILEACEDMYKIFGKGCLIPGQFILHSKIGEILKVCEIVHCRDKNIEEYMAERQFVWYFDLSRDFIYFHNHTDLALAKLLL